MKIDDLKSAIRLVPDFPKSGITFYDLTPLFQNPDTLRELTRCMVERYREARPEAVAGIEARGFILGSLMALELGVGLVLLRKPGKLPWDKEREEYTLEYGTASLEVHRDAVRSGQRVLVVDDLLATGGTASAAGRLLRRLGARIHGYAFLVELGFLGGRRPLGDADVFSLLRYS